MFFRLTYNRAFYFRGEEHVCGKLSKDRISVYVFANVDELRRENCLWLESQRMQDALREKKNLPVHNMILPTKNHWWLPICLKPNWGLWTWIRKQMRKFIAYRQPLNAAITMLADYSYHGK